MLVILLTTGRKTWQLCKRMHGTTMCLGQQHIHQGIVYHIANSKPQLRYLASYTIPFLRSQWLVGWSSYPDYSWGDWQWGWRHLYRCIAICHKIGLRSSLQLGHTLVALSFSNTYRISKASHKEISHNLWQWKKGGLSSSSTSFVWAAARSNSLSHRQPSLLQQDDVITDNARCRWFDLKSPHFTVKFERLSKQ